MNALNSGAIAPLYWGKCNSTASALGVGVISPPGRITPWYSLTKYTPSELVLGLTGPSGMWSR